MATHRRTINRLIRLPEGDDDGIGYRYGDHHSTIIAVAVAVFLAYVLCLRESQTAVKGALNERAVQRATCQGPVDKLDSIAKRIGTYSI